MKKALALALALAMCSATVDAKPFYKNWKFYAAVGAIALGAVVATNVSHGQPVPSLPKNIGPVPVAPLIPSQGAR